LSRAQSTPISSIVNPSFETGAPGNVPTGWTVASGGNPYWIGASLVGNANPPGAYDGSQFISASWEIAGLPNANTLIGGANNSALIYQDIDLLPYSTQISQGDRYLGLSYAYFVNDGNDFGSIDYDFYDAGNSIVGTYGVEAQAGGAGWVTIEDFAATPVPFDASRLRISIGAGLNQGAGGSARNVAFDAIGVSLEPAPPPPEPELPSGLVNGNLIQFDSDGNWTWYTQERSIVDPNNGHVLVNSIGFSPTVGGGPNVDVVAFDPATGSRVRTRLSNQVPGNPAIQVDDHNVGALLVLPDGRYLSMYANHGNSGGLGDRWSRWRRSINPGDSTSWTTEQLFDWHEEVPGANEATDASDPGNVTYHNLFYLSAEDQVYNISRSYGQLSANGATQNMPNIMRYDVETNTVEWAGQFLESEAQGYSAYPKYASNGVDRIYFMSTETHPRNFNNNIFSGYYQGGQLFDMLGNVIDQDVFDNGTPEGGSGFVADVTDFTIVQEADPLGDGHNRLWTVDMNLDAGGDPMGLFVSRWNPDGSSNVGNAGDEVIIDHRLHFARWNSSTLAWETQELAKMGRRLYGPEQDYTGLGALIPGDEHKLYISTPYDPRDPLGETETPHHEIYRGEFDGNQWNWTAITENSSVDNLRPIAPDTHGAAPQTVFWFRGNYTTAHNINAAVVGIVEREPEDQIGPITYVDADVTNTMFATGGALVTSTPSDSSGPDDNLWHERTGFGNGDSVLTSNESGTENAPTLKTTIEDLQAGTYEVFAYFWSDNDEDWRLLAGLDQDNLMDFRMYGSQHAEADQFVAIEEVSANENDLLLYRAYLGRQEVAEGADIGVFIDDWQTLGGDNANRTWYDGIGYAFVEALAPLLAGDYNDDGVVNAADYVVWRNKLDSDEALLNETATPGMVTAEDYDVWRVNFGNTIESSEAASVPEPATLAMLAAILCLISTWRTRTYSK
jgi:hypothetical protein